MLSIKNLEKSYKDGDRQTPIVRGVSFDIQPGEIYTLLGPSGCGKTTIIRCLAGLETPDSGEIWIGGRQVYSKREGINVPVMHRNIGMVFQSYALWPHMTVFENVAFPMRYGPKKLTRSAIRSRVQTALEMVQMQDFSDRQSPMLSGGQQQRVALARALVYEPDVLLLDEPLSNLDARLRVKMRSLLRNLIKQLKIAALCVTHDQEEALAISDCIAVTRAGRILQSGAPKRIYEQPIDIDVANFLGEMNFFQATPDGFDQHGRLRLKSDFGTIFVGSDARARDIEISTPVWVTIRPHRVVIKPCNGALPDNCFKGRVEAVEFLGPRKRYSIGLGTKNCIVEVPDSAFEEGNTVAIEFPEQYFSVIPRAPEQELVSQLIDRRAS